MKKGLIATLIAYVLLLLAVAAMMLTYVILKNNNTPNISGLFKAVTYVFIAFVVVFIAVIAMLVIYPKVLQKEYKSHIEGFMKEHKEKYPDADGQIVITYKDKNVFFSYFMSEQDIDSYSFTLKEKPLTKSEPKRIAMNAVEELLSEQLKAAN